MTVNIDVIGGVRAMVDGQPVRLRRQVQRVAAILVAAGPVGIEGSALAEELWLGDPPTRWNSAVRNAVTSLRAVIGPDAVETNSGRYSLQCTIESVDAWRVLAAAASPATDTARLGSIGRFQPFNGLELTPLLQEMSEALHRARLQWIQQVTTVDGLDAALVTELVASVRTDPFAEPTAVAIIDLLTRIGQTADALQLLDDIEAAYRVELETDPPPAIMRVRRLAEGADDDLAVTRTTQLPPTLPSIIGDLIQRPMTRRHQELAMQAATQITDPSRPKRWSILDLAGSGKSRFAAEIGHRLHQTGSNVIFATAVGDESSAYSPFLTASPLFRQRFLDLATPTESAVWAVWSSILENFGAQGRPIALIVDDAHLLDRPSIRLLQFMHRMESAVPITTVVVGRRSTDEHDWRAFERELLDDDRTVTIDIPPLDTDDVVSLVADRWPHVSDMVCRDAAVEVARASGGLPMITHLLVDSLTGPTLRLPRRKRSHHVDMAADRLHSFDPAMQEVLAAATLVSSPFTADALGTLLDRDPDDVDELLDRAARAAVLANMEEPGKYRFVHDLLRQGAVRLASRSVRAEWGRQLMATTEDALRLARLALVAEDLLTTEEVARRLAAGANAALDRNLLRRTVDLAQRALDLGPPSDHEALACLAVAQAKLGALDEAASTRAALLERTHSPAEHARATRALLDSIVYVEIDNPTTVQVRDFDRLDVASLPHELQVERSVRLARLATNEADHQRRDAELALTRSLQRTNIEAAQLFYAEWSCEAHAIDAAWFERLAQIKAAVDGDEVASLLTQIEALELAALGRWAEAEHGNAAFLEMATRDASAERQWQARLTSAGFALARGDLDESDRLADEAFAFGSLYALPHAPAARAAQAFGVALHRGTVDEWLAFIEMVSPDLLRNTLAMAAVGRARFEVGRVDDAWEIAGPILPATLDGEHRVAVSIVSVLAPLIRRRAAPALRQRCVELLRTAGDRWVITGAGIGVHGPATRSLAIVESDHRALQRVRHQLADIPLWATALDADIARVQRER